MPHFVCRKGPSRVTKIKGQLIFNTCGRCATIKGSTPTSYSLRTYKFIFAPFYSITTCVAKEMIRDLMHVGCNSWIVRK
jgi:hypothetical protein